MYSNTLSSIDYAAMKVMKFSIDLFGLTGTLNLLNHSDSFAALIFASSSILFFYALIGPSSLAFSPEYQR